MKVLIIEDEKPAAEKLQKAIALAGKDIVIEKMLSSVQAATEWLQQHPPPDLIFMDIELTDGLSFKILENVPVTCPIIFTTAFDEYWQEAFELNSIDYLLKPVKQEKLEAALKKYDTLKQYFASNFQQLMQTKPASLPAYKKRFLVKRGTDYISVKTEDIAYFYATHKLVCMVNKKSEKFILDISLSDIEKQIDPVSFYRINRKYLVNMTSIKRIKSYPKSKLEVEVDPPVNDEIIISQENVAAFKDWMGN